MLIPGIGPIGLRARAPHVTDAIAAVRAARVEFAGRFDPSTLRARIAACRRSIDDLEIRLIAAGDAEYVDALHHVHPPPCILFARGRTDLLGRPNVSVIGSRGCTEYGVSAARYITGSVARAGVVITSGLALGIDSVAHRAALEAGGDTIAVLGCGIDVAYPRQHRALQEEIATTGLLLSEYPPGTRPLGHHFPVRNRIIAALGSVLVVIEARLKSGTQSTARAALDAGKDVFVVPGPIGRETSAGSNQLLKDGCHVLTEPEDILFNLGLPLQTPAGKRIAVPVPGRYEPLWSVLSSEPLCLDDVARRTGWTAPAALSGLTDLELLGLARQVTGGRFVAQSPA